MTENEDKLAYLLDDQPPTDPVGAIDAVARDVNLQYRLRRYRMIGEVMRHQLPRSIDPDFHSQVMARIRTEALIRKASALSSHARHQRTPRLNWITLKPFAGLAVAASVAVATVALWQQQSAGKGETVAGAGTQEVTRLAGQPVQGGAIPVSAPLALGTRWKFERSNPDIQRKLNGYLVNHTEYSNSVQGLIPQARVAGFDAQQ